MLLVMKSCFCSAVLVLSFVEYSLSLIILRTLPTQARGETTVFAPSPKPTTTPHLNSDLLKRDEACGFLGDAYSNAQVPICAGTATICTFSDHLQGCCDGQGNCNFYTSCNGYFTSQPNPGPSCLSCPSAKPYCTKFEFYQAGYGNYDAYSCGNFDIQETVFGLVSPGSAVNTNTPTATAILTNSVSSTLNTSTSSYIASDPQSSSLKPPTALSTQKASRTTSQLQSNTSSSQSSSSAITPIQSNQSSHNHLAAIVGGAVGGVAAIGIIGAIVWCCRGRQPVDQNRRFLQQGRPPSSQYGR